MNENVFFNTTRYYECFFVALIFITELITGQVYFLHCVLFFQSVYLCFTFYLFVIFLSDTSPVSSIRSKPIPHGSS